jgi:pyrimidine deaminase RibD-like protein
MQYSLKVVLLCILKAQTEAFAPGSVRNVSFMNKNTVASHQKLYASTLIESGDSKGVNATATDKAELDIDSLVEKVATNGGTSEDKAEDAITEDLIEDEAELSEQEIMDRDMMEMAMQMARSSGGERGSHSAFPKPIEGAVLATADGRVLGRGRSSYEHNAVQAAIADAGIEATPLSEWCVSWPSSSKLRDDLKESTLYVTLEPSQRRQGKSLPPMTQLIQMAGITRVVIGTADPVPEYASEGAAAMHSAGLEVIMGGNDEECQEIIEEYSELANSKLQKMARKHFKQFGRPLGFLHCSVVDSNNVESFARNGNSFGKDFGGGQRLSFREFGSYELAPPPESIWANGEDDEGEEDFTEIDDFFGLDDSPDEEKKSNPMMPWYEQMDAIVATFPREGHGKQDDQSIMSRLNGLKWLATSGEVLPANVERILVLDATDLGDLPVSNDDPNLPPGVDVETFWKGDGRKPSRILLRSGDNAFAATAAAAAAAAAEQAAQAAELAKIAIESGEAEKAAEAALKCQEMALVATKELQKEMQSSQNLKQRLIDLGVKVEVIKGRQPIDVMNHLGQRNGYHAVAWRAGCWGTRGVQAIVAGAFQWVSAHLAVDAIGGKFWQLMLSERAVQAACGSENKVKVLAEQEDFSLEYCDDETRDCELTVNGKAIRHIRLDCRVLVIDEEREHEYILTKTAPVKERITEEAPWFL